MALLSDSGFPIKRCFHANGESMASCLTTGPLKPGINQSQRANSDDETAEINRGLEDKLVAISSRRHNWVELRRAFLTKFNSLAAPISYRLAFLGIRLGVIGTVDVKRQLARTALTPPNPRSGRFLQSVS
jgi:hypothetical protein